MSRLNTAATHPACNDNNGPATPTEYHLVKRMLATLLVATCSLGVSAQNVAPTVAMTAPAANTKFSAPAALILSADAADSDGIVTKVAFYNGATLLGTDTVAPFSYTWANVPIGSYSLTAKVTDNSGLVTTSAAAIVTVTANVAPTVSVTSPVSNAIVNGPATLTLVADAADSDGIVKYVGFYNGREPIGVATRAPFKVVWPDVAVGNYSVTARAIDDKGASTSTAPVLVNVVPTAPLPGVTITAPLNNARYIAPATLTFTGAASVTGDTISKVEYFSGSNMIGMATAPPYTVTLNNIAAGAYTVTAKATGSAGGTTASGSVSLMVFDNAAPAVSLSASPATAAAPAAIALNATASDSDGTIARVEFYSGATLLATVTQAPYSYTWNAVAAGTYALSAKVFDELGLSTTSAASNVAVTAPVAAETGQVFYIYSDQINTAREITNSAGTKVWQADPDPFGANLPDENPAGQGQFTYNQRFPGQYFDRETGLHYNYYRDYDPQTGRYIQSDPIGLEGGINTYGYVGGNPLSFVDPEGLQRFGPRFLPRTPAPSPLVDPLDLPPAHPKLPSAESINAAICDSMPMGCAVLNIVEAAASSIIDACRDDDEVNRCAKVLVTCREACTPGMRRGGTDSPGAYRKCVRSCMESKGCYDF